MKIGIDISQLAYEKTGVANLLRGFVKGLLAVDNQNEYVLFFSSLRREINDREFTTTGTKVSLKKFRFPPTLLDILWNKLHVLPIEALIGDVDIFISSDWTEPPTRRAKKATILYDLVVYKAPHETATKIVETQKRKLHWTKKECDVILCISESTKRDAMEILGIAQDRLKVAYPGI